MTDTMTDKPRRPGRPPMPRDAEGNIIRGETPEQPVIEPGPEPVVEPESVPEVVPDRPAEQEPQAPEPVAEPVVQEPPPILAERNQTGTTYGRQQPVPPTPPAGPVGEENERMDNILFTCTGCGKFTCQGIPDGPKCPTCGHPWPSWKARE